MQPYVPTAEPLLDDEAPNSGKKSKKKKKQMSVDPYVLPDQNVEMVEVSDHSAKKKDKKKKKSKKSKRNLDTKREADENTKKEPEGDEYDPYQKYDEANANYAQATVLSSSGWEVLDAKVWNGGHTSAQAVGLKYAITGDESQIVTVEIPPGESCQGEPGSMMYLSNAIDMKVSCGGDWFGRCCGGESCCVVNFNNTTRSGEVGYAGLVTNDPLAKVVPIEMGSDAVGRSLIVQQGAYMASYGEVKITFDCDCNLMRCCCGGMGLVRQKIEGTGTAFLGATGTIVQKVLAQNEVMLCDTNCILAYAESCTFDIKKTGGIVNWIGGGEGFFNSSVKGPGLVVVQSMNMLMLLEALAADKMYRR